MVANNYKLAALLLAASATASPFNTVREYFGGSPLELVTISETINIDIDLKGTIAGLLEQNGDEAYTLRCLNGEEEGYGSGSITGIDVDALLAALDLGNLLESLGLSDLLDLEDLVDLSVILNLGGDGNIRISLGDILLRLSGGNEYGGYDAQRPGWNYGGCGAGAFANGEICLNAPLCTILQALVPDIALLSCPTSQYGPGWGYGDDYASAPMPTDWKPKKYCEKSQLCKTDQYGGSKCEDSKWCKPMTPGTPGYAPENDYVPSTPPATGDYATPQSSPSYGGEGAPFGNYGDVAPGNPGRCRAGELGEVDLDLSIEVDTATDSVLVKADTMLSIGVLPRGCAAKRCQKMCEANSGRGYEKVGNQCKAFAVYEEEGNDNVLCGLYSDFIVDIDLQDANPLLHTTIFNLRIDVSVDLD